jgi:hypothetical protein
MGEAAGLGEAVVRLNQERLAGLGEAAAGDAPADVDSAAAVSFFLERFFFSAGEAAGDSDDEGLWAAVADSVVSFFLECLCLTGEAAGDSAGEGLWANRAVAANVSAIAE